MLELERETVLETLLEGQSQFFRWKCPLCETVGVVSYKDTYDDVVMNRLSDQHESVTEGCPTAKVTVVDLLENWQRGEGVESLPKQFRAEIYECQACDSWTRGTFCLPCIG